MIDRATVDKIIDTARIVDVVSDFVTLRKAGVNYKGLCPFHDDRNPSFMVSPAKNICHCFVCGKGGTPAKFLMEHEQITYPEALRWLARKYNIEIVEKELTDEERAQQNERESMFVVNEWARDWFHDTLKNTPDGIAIGRQYFRSRGIRDDIIERFQLGYSPQRRDALAQAALKKGFKAEFLTKTGLCYEKAPLSSHEGKAPLSPPEGGTIPSALESIEAPSGAVGGAYPKGAVGGAAGGGSAELIDRYRGRAIFPWLNVSGKVVAFGGRVLDARTKGVAQKYVNSPDSEIYHKERERYGIYQAKKAIVKEDRVFMVEGYTDVIAMHQAGIENVVANSGTALSVYQIHLLHRFTPNITLLYDGDEAGIHAAMRGTDMLLAEGMNIKVLLLPDGDDPDSFARKHSTEELKRYIDENQTDFITFKTRLTVQNVSDPVKRSQGISGIVKSISVIPDQILRSTYLSDFAQRVGLKEQTLVAEMNKYIRADIEEKAKEREREARRQETTAVSPEATTTTPQPLNTTPPPSTTSQLLTPNSPLPHLLGRDAPRTRAGASWRRNHLQGHRDRRRAESVALRGPIHRLRPLAGRPAVRLAPAPPDTGRGRQPQPGHAGLQGRDLLHLPPRPSGEPAGHQPVRRPPPAGRTLQVRQRRGRPADTPGEAHRATATARAAPHDGFPPEHRRVTTQGNTTTAAPGRLRPRPHHAAATRT